MHCEELEKEWKEKLAEWDKHMRGEIQDIKPYFSPFSLVSLLANSSFSLVLFARFEATSTCGVRYRTSNPSFPYISLVSVSVFISFC